MSELKTIKLSQIEPNPFRDGSGGEATWQSVSDTYPFLKSKIERLMQSYEAVNIWEGIIVREHGSKYQLAFGHHRVVAAKRMNITNVPVIVKDLNDNDMLMYMAQENAQEDKDGFLLATMNPIEAVVRAYGAGVIELEKPPEGGGGSRAT